MKKLEKKEMQPSPSSTPMGGGHGSYRLRIVVVLHLDLLLHLDIVFLLLEDLVAQGSVVDEGLTWQMS
jgi:hypothetical protein